MTQGKIRGDTRIVQPICLGVISAVGILAGTLWFWTVHAEQEIHYTPEYEKQDLTIFLNKIGENNLTTAEYELLYRQTGLSRVAIDALCRQNRQNEILNAQERFFADVETQCECDFLLFQENINTACLMPDERNVIPVLEDGDILITFSSHFLGWRNGHAGIVVDAEKGLTLEAISLGKNSMILSVESWRNCPEFAVLRLRDVPEEIRKEIAVYAREHLVDIPYRLSAVNYYSVQEKRNAEAEQSAVVSGTHCAHLVWYAYRQFGYDLDSDGGIIVTPRDLFESPFLEVIQVYGMKPS